MKLQINARSKNLSRIRRKQIFAILFSTSLFACHGTNFVAAEDLTPPTFTATSTQAEKPTVLKSVGIKFVAHAPQEKVLTNSPANSTTPPKLLNQSTGLAAPSTDSKLSKSADVLTMPPMLAGASPNSATTPRKEVGTVKIQIDPNSEAKKVIQLAPLVAAEKPAAPKQTAEAIKPNTVSVPVSPPPAINQIEAPVSSHVDIATESTAVGPKLTEPSILETVPELATKTDTAKETATASNIKTDEATTSVVSRAPNIVRIPSMTLVQKSSEEPALKIAQEKPHLAQLEPAQPAIAAKPPYEREEPLVLPSRSDSVVGRRDLKTEPVLHDLPKTQEFEKANSDVVQLDQRALIRAKSEQENAEKLANTRQKNISESQAETKAPTTFVAVPVSAIKVTSPIANEMSKASKHKISDQNSGTHSTVASNSLIEILLRDVQNVKIDGDVEKIEVEDESICKGIVSDSKGLMLLGVGRGATRVKVWTISESSVNQWPQVLEIAVREAWTNSSHQNGMTIGEATKSISELFPTSRIAIKSHENGALTVFGTTESGDQAKQVVSLVRKMFLVPVQDRIAVASVH